MLGKKVKLRLVATNLSAARPYNLPLGDGFKIHRRDLGWLLPSNVAEWIQTRDESPDGDYFAVPSGDDMPVILAVRMSLSFPVLFSAVPLHSKDHSLRVNTKQCEEQSKRYWLNLFSDGGLSSNFPIHYFDALLPLRPTFGVNLTQYHECRHGDDRGASGWNRIYLPSQAGGGLTYGVNPIEGIPAFLFSLLDAARNWQDSMQMRMPGYRERIVHVSLKPNEGGSNLTMPKETIDWLVNLGNIAGERILKGHAQQLDTQPKFSFEIHRWRRLLAVTDALGQILPELKNAYQSTPGGDPTLSSIQNFINNLSTTYQPGSMAGFGYEPPNVGEVQKLKDRWDALLALESAWVANPLSPMWNMPSPEGVIRVRPSGF
jgi:predicted acylesterase/phospholipase RssA